MIRNFTPQNYNGLNSLPNYVSNIKIFTLIGDISGGYKITLARLTVGNSDSAGNSLSHDRIEVYQVQ